MYIVPPLAELCCDGYCLVGVILDMVYRFVTKLNNLATKPGLLSQEMQQIDLTAFTLSEKCPICDPQTYHVPAQSVNAVQCVESTHRHRCHGGLAGGPWIG